MNYVRLLSFILFSFLFCFDAAAESNKQGNIQYAGLRRSSYSCEKRNPKLCKDHAWWAKRAQEFADSIGGDHEVQPVIIEIVSIYLSGTCEMEFEKPTTYTGDIKGIDNFNPNASIDHEQALLTYDRLGVKAILQIESGNANVLACLDILNEAFGHHPCIIGYGVDAEWYFAKESKDKTGRPIKDEDVKRWVDKVTSFNPSYTLFLKHWETSHMPPTFRDDHLWFLNDSQGFKNSTKMLKEFQAWGDVYKNEVVGFQFGYKKDRKWWSKMEQPAKEIAEKLQKDIPNTKFLFWVDFTADSIRFSNETK